MHCMQVWYYFLCCCIMFTTDDGCSFPFHTLMADLINCQGGSSMLLKIFTHSLYFSTLCIKRWAKHSWVWPCARHAHQKGKCGISGGDGCCSRQQRQCWMTCVPNLLLIENKRFCWLKEMLKCTKFSSHWNLSMVMSSHGSFLIQVTGTCLKISK